LFIFSAIIKNKFGVTTTTKEAISNLSTNPTLQKMKQGSRFLISSLIIDGGARPSIIQNIRLTEVDMAEQVKLKEDRSTYWVIPVHHHKTDLQGTSLQK
jgi:hypothetical protein